MPDSEEMLLRVALVDALESLIVQKFVLMATLEVAAGSDWEIAWADTVSRVQDTLPEQLRKMLDEFRDLVLSHDDQVAPTPDWRKVVQDLVLSADEIDPPEDHA